MTAGPWRLDALEILRVARMASFDRRHLADVIREIVDTGELKTDDAEADTTDEPTPTAEADTTDDADATPEPTTTAPVAPDTRAKLRRLLDTLEELTPETWREGPFTILERFIERTGQVLDLIAVGTLEAQRSVANIASFLRFASDWQGANPNGTLAGFVAYLDAYRDAGGELPTSVELTEDVEGVRLMTLYQAKGLEFRTSSSRACSTGEWPAREYGSGLFPPELLREAVPAGDIHTDEERRLLYVAMTRAQDRLILTTHGGPTVQKGPSPFVAELLDGAGPELRHVDRTADADRRGGGAGRGRRGRRLSTEPTTTPTRPTGPPSPPTPSSGRPRSSAGSCRSRRSASAASPSASGRPSSSACSRAPTPPTPRPTPPATASPPTSRPSAGRPRWSPTRPAPSGSTR